MPYYLAMASWKNPDLFVRLLNPQDAREYISKFEWKEHGFPEGRPAAFMSRNERYYTHCNDDRSAIQCALALMSDFEIERAMNEKMYLEFEV